MAKCKECIHKDVCYLIEHYGKDLYSNETCDKFLAIPVVHGRWIDHKKFERNNCNVCIECSVCNTWFGHDCIPKTKFCPNCGARMDGNEVE